MFDTLVLDRVGSPPGHRGTATLISFALQAVGIGLMLLIPLLYTDALPGVHFAQVLTAPVSHAAPAEKPMEVFTEHHSVASEFNREGQLVTPSKVPEKINIVVDRIAPQASGDTGPDIIGAIHDPTSGGAGNNALNRLLAMNTNPANIGMANTHREPLRISHMDPGMIVRQVQPVYPRNAILTRTEGTVMVAALISTDGRIVNAHVLSGPPLLMQAALDAVKQWRYKPYMLNGAPVEVETQVSVIFSLNH